MRFQSRLLAEAYDDVPSDPVERALRRMDDAFKRGGIQGMVRATEIRMNATKDRAKLLGMVHAILKAIDTKRFGSVAAHYLERLAQVGNNAIDKATG